MLDVPDWLDDLVPLVDPAAPPRVLTRAEARSLGYTDAMIRHRLHTGRWRRMLAGIYLTASEPIQADHIRVAAKHGGPGCVLSGAAALVERGILRGPAAGELVLVRPSVRVRTSGRVRVCRTSRVPAAEFPTTVPLAPVARCVADHVVTLSRLDDVRAVVGPVVQRRLTTVEELGAELRHRPRNGTAHLRQALEDVGHGAHSAPEARAAFVLRRGGVTHFEQNAPVVTPGGRYVVDFLDRPRMAVLEIDSREHHFAVADWRRTLRRHADLETAGYSVIHVSPAELRDEAEFLARVRRWLASRKPLDR